MQKKYDEYTNSPDDWECEIEGAKLLQEKLPKKPFFQQRGKTGTETERSLKVRLVKS